MQAFYRNDINIRISFLISLILLLSFVSISAQVYVIGDATIIAEKSIVATENLKNSLSPVTVSAKKNQNCQYSEKNIVKRKFYSKKNKTLTHRKLRNHLKDHFKHVLQNFCKNTDDRYFRQYDSFQKSVVLQDNQSKSGTVAENDSRFNIIVFFKRNKFLYTFTPILCRSKECFLTRPPPTVS